MYSLFDAHRAPSCSCIIHPEHYKAMLLTQKTIARMGFMSTTIHIGMVIEEYADDPNLITARARGLLAMLEKQDYMHKRIVLVVQCPRGQLSLDASHYEPALRIIAGALRSCLMRFSLCYVVIVAEKEEDIHPFLYDLINDPIFYNGPDHNVTQTSLKLRLLMTGCMLMPDVDIEELSTWASYVSADKLMQSFADALTDQLKEHPKLREEDPCIISQYDVLVSIVHALPEGQQRDELTNHLATLLFDASQSI